MVSLAATPAGYWFLKGFEINKIASSLTYMNMMCTWNDTFEFKE